MDWKGSLVGGIVGVAIGAGGYTLLHLPAKWMAAPPEESIALADKAFFDSAKYTEDGYVIVSGSITGDHVGYKNNTLTARCAKAEMRCVVASAAQIGANQLSKIDVDDWDITEWSPSLIVAHTDDLCATTTMNIERGTMAIGYVKVPTNQTKPGCADSDTEIFKWTVDESPFWRRLRAALNPGDHQSK